MLRALEALKTVLVCCRMLYFCRHATALNPDRVDRADAAMLAMRIVNMRSQRWRDVHGPSHDMNRIRREFLKLSGKAAAVRIA
jgi:hypothetical protein